MRPLLVIAAILLALGVVEGVSYWWMHPAPAGLGEPVLVYRPVGRDPARSAHLSPAARDDKEHAAGNREQGTGAGEQEDAPAQNPTLTSDVGSSMLDVPSSSSNQKSKTNNQQSSISPSSSAPSTINPQLSTSSASTYTPLPEIVSAALPSLRCTTGTAARIESEDGVSIHVAFFEWDLSSSSNVLEAFKHLPEECMGSIGMTLIEKAPPRSFTVGLDRRAGPLVANGAERQGPEIVDRGSEIADDPSSSSNQQSTTHNPQSSISPSSPNLQSPISNRSSSTLSFDHTVFRDPRGVMVHAFKGTWVSGASTLLGDGIRGGEEQWNQLRWRAAQKRFRPAHARVAQGAVRGIRDPDLAWQAFEEAMLRDLRFAVLKK
jgi:hypothetical protein